MAQENNQGQILTTTTAANPGHIGSGIKGSSASGRRTGGPVPLNTLHSTAGEQESTSFQSEDTKQICQNRKVQTRKFGLSENHDETERPFDEIRPEGCILLCSNRRGTPEIPSISVSRCDLRIPVSTLRFIVSATNLHETSQASDCHTENIRHTSSDLFGRSTALPPGSSRAPENLQDCNHSFHRSRVRHQTREVLTLTHASNHLSGCTAELARPYDSCSSGETLPHTIGVQRDPDQGVVLHAGTLGTAGSDESDCTDWDLGSAIALPSCSTNVHCSPAQERSLHTIKAVPDSPNEGSILRTQMVVFRETESNQPDGVEPPGNRRNNIDGRLQERLGGKLSGPKDGGSVAEGRGGTHQCIRTESRLPCYPGICQRHHESTPYSGAYGQLYGGVIHKQTRGDTFTNSGVVGVRDMEILHLSADMDYSETCSRGDQHRCRFCVEELQRSNGMDTQQDGIPENNQKVLYARSGPICLSAQQPATTLCGQIPRPGVNCDGCFSSTLGTVEGVHTCSNSAPASDSAETTTESSNGTGDSPDLARAAVVSNPSGVTSGLSSSVTNSGRNNLLAVRSASNTSYVENPPTSCMAAVRSRLQTTGLSPEVCKIMLASWRTSTQKRYEGPWQQWAGWCMQRNKCPFSAPVADVLDFLSEQFNDRNLAYRTVGVYKACISQMHDPVDGLQLGSLPLVSRFMKGIFQLRPATPRVCTTWQVGPVLRYLSSLEPLEELSLKILSLKLTTLLALTSAAWAHEIASLHLDHLSKKVDSCEFIIPTHVKNSRPYHPSRKIFLGRYQQDCSICVVRCLEHYLQRTCNHRQHKQLLLSYVSPYKSVGSQTVSRWICALIRSAGVDVCYTGHSTRAASTSEAVDNGVPFEVVLEAADWSSAQTFEKHYHKRAEKARFAHTVLDAINY